MLQAIPRTSYTTSLRKWRKLLGLLYSITPDVVGYRGMFTSVHHTLTRAAGRHSHLTKDVNDDLEAWRELVCRLAIWPTHLRELQTSPPTWMGTPYESGSGMGGGGLSRPVSTILRLALILSPSNPGMPG